MRDCAKAGTVVVLAHRFCWHDLDSNRSSCLPVARTDRRERCVEILSHDGLQPLTSRERMDDCHHCLTNQHVLRGMGALIETEKETPTRRLCLTC